MYESLINIAIMECNPDKVLNWYDKQPRQKTVFSYGVDQDRIADATYQHAPERMVAFWIDRAEEYIAGAKPNAYHSAGSVKLLSICTKSSPAQALFSSERVPDQNFAAYSASIPASY